MKHYTVLIIFLISAIASLSNLFSRETFECKNKDQVVILNISNLGDTISDVKMLFNGAFNLEACRTKDFKLLKYEINPKNLEQLIAKLNCIGHWIDRNKKGNEKFAEDILRFNVIVEFIAIIVKNFKGLTDEQAKHFAQNVQEDVEKKLQQIITINSNAVRIIDKATDNSKNWKNTVPKLSKFEQLKLLGKNGEYTNLFKDYLESKMNSKEYLHAIVSSINQDLLNQETTLEDLGSTVDDLEKIIYRLKLTNSLDLFNLKQQLALSKFCKDLLDALITFYGDGLYYQSDSLQDKLSVNKNFQATIITYLSSFAFTVLNKLYDEVTNKSERTPILPILVNFNKK
jgi:hypothetical protein